MTTPTREQVVQWAKGMNGGFDVKVHQLISFTTLARADLEAENAKLRGFLDQNAAQLANCELALGEHDEEVKTARGTAEYWKSEHIEGNKLVKRLFEELETERLRLAACGVAALGYFNGCKDEYRSASLDDVLRMRAELESLRKDAERYRWLKSQRGLDLSSCGGSWIKGDTKFNASHRLCANDTAYAPYETLDETIDAAIEAEPAMAHSAMKEK